MSCCDWEDGPRIHQEDCPTGLGDERATKLLKKVDEFEEWFLNTGIRPAEKRELEAWNWVAKNFAAEMRHAIKNSR